MIMKYSKFSSYSIFVCRQIRDKKLFFDETFDNFFWFLMNSMILKNLYKSFQYFFYDFEKEFQNFEKNEWKVMNFLYFFETRFHIKLKKFLNYWTNCFKDTASNFLSKTVFSRSQENSEFFFLSLVIRKIND